MGPTLLPTIGHVQNLAILNQHFDLRFLTDRITESSHLNVLVRQSTLIVTGPDHLLAVAVTILVDAAAFTHISVFVGGLRGLLNSVGAPRSRGPIDVFVGV